MSLTIWGRLSSINVQKVMWALDEIGLAYEHVDAGGAAGGLNAPAFRAMNPHGRIPVIDDDGTVVWESNAVVRYLCAAHSHALSPADPAARAQCDQWMDWTATALQPAMMGLFWGFYRTPESERDTRRNAAFLADANREFGLLDKVLATRPYVAGDHFTMADIPAGTLLFRWYGMGVETAALPHLEAWQARLRERPAYKAQVMRPFDDLKGRLAF